MPKNQTQIFGSMIRLKITMRKEHDVMQKNIDKYLVEYTFRKMLFSER